VYNEAMPVLYGKNAFFVVVVDQAGLRVSKFISCIGLRHARHVKHIIVGWVKKDGRNHIGSSFDGSIEAELSQLAQNTDVRRLDIRFFQPDSGLDWNWDLVTSILREMFFGSQNCHTRSSIHEMVDAPLADPRFTPCLLLQNLVTVRLSSWC
jgi:hypothetical protein